VWIPGHTGLLGNENADAEVKKAAARDRVDDATLEFRGFRRIVSEVGFTARKNRWTNVEDNKMKEHKNLPSKDRSNLTGKRSENVFISRKRIGHTRFTQGYLMKRVQSFCESCGRLLTIKHLLVECRMHQIRWTQSKAAGRPGTAFCSVLADSGGTTKRIIEYIDNLLTPLYSFIFHNINQTYTLFKFAFAKKQLNVKSILFFSREEENCAKRSQKHIQ
jgi:hypothetical protein